jgi:diguanylate cyclase (GGDEF)-like protein/PAS domain S-box-containing protein
MNCADVKDGEAQMTDRTELVEAALDSLPNGIALLGTDCEIVFWNRAAEAITGHASVDLLARPAPEALEPLLCAARDGNREEDAATETGHGVPVLARHKLGHDVRAIARSLILRDGMGRRIGTAVVFHPAESLDALPRGDCGEGSGVEKSQTDLEERIEEEFEDFTRAGVPFGVLWITVDQAHQLRKTHGAGACEAMLEKMEHALVNGLRPAEELGRWGDDEFLVLSHERTAEMLAAYAQRLTGAARTADFRWWGDRVSLTVSIGAAQANLQETLAQLLGRAQEAMVASMHEGGNHITLAPEGQSCLPS